MTGPIISSYHTSFDFDDMDEEPLPLKSGIWHELTTSPGPFDSKRDAAVAILLLLFPFSIYYLVDLVLYHYTYRSGSDSQVPPNFPHPVPFLGNILSFAFDTANFVKTATRYRGSLVPTRISMLLGDVLLVQGVQNVSAVWTKRDLSSPIVVYSFALRHIFGMPKRALRSYLMDNSGSSSRAHPESKVLSHNRVDFLTHQGLHKAFTGSYLNHSFARTSQTFKRNLASLTVGDSEWVEMTDLLAFFQDHLGTAVIEALFGPSLLRLSPNFMQDLWIFDHSVTDFAKMAPRFLSPGAYEARDRLIDSIKRWHAYAREHFDPSAIRPDGDADPYWGSQLIRSRQTYLLAVDGQDEEAVASNDLGLIWASVTNLVPSSMMCALHIFGDSQLVARVRSTLNAGFDAATWDVNMDKILCNSLLSSIYAETLRLHVKVFITRCSQHSDVKLGSWWLPKNWLCMVPTQPSHMDHSFWNTRNETFPVESFWAERFLVDPKDPLSGPARSDVLPSLYKRPTVPPASSSPSADRDKSVPKPEKDEPFFSTHGLEGAWIPYGGGYASCPGRHFAKRVMMYSSALLLSAFDVQILVDKPELDNSKYGLGIERPKLAVPFKIRRRAKGVEPLMD